MDASIFVNKEEHPTSSLLVKVLGEKTYNLWMKIRDHVLAQYPQAKEEWSFAGKKYGWSFRIKDKKRAIIYLLPRKELFKAAFVFGQKATDQILDSPVSEKIKAELQSARVYAEGRGIRITVDDPSIISDIDKLVKIKLAN